MWYPATVPDPKANADQGQSAVLGIIYDMQIHYIAIRRNYDQKISNGCFTPFSWITLSSLHT